MGSLGTFAKKGVYFVGIGGVSMSALAQLLHAQGIPVRGCDVRENHFTRKLRALGIPVVIGTDAPREETIVYTEAADAHAALLRRAEEEGKTVLSRAAFLGLLARYPGCYVELTLHLTAPLTAQETQALRSANEGLVSLIVRTEGAEATPVVRRSMLSSRELFAEYYRSVYGEAPPQELTQAFLELLERS